MHAKFCTPPMYTALCSLWCCQAGYVSAVPCKVMLCSAMQRAQISHLSPELSTEELQDQVLSRVVVFAGLR